MGIKENDQMMVRCCDAGEEKKLLDAAPGLGLSVDTGTRGIESRKRAYYLNTFVYLLDPENNARGSYAPEQGLSLSLLSKEILRCCEIEGIATVNCHDLSGFTPENAVRFKHVRRGDHTEDLSYPDYIGIPFSPGNDPYPYPPEAARMTYDGLHPTDEGCEILAELFAEQIRRTLRTAG